MKPSRYFVRVWTIDPAGEDPDEEDDSTIPDGAEAEWVARRTAKELRRKGRNAGAFERRNIELPAFIPAGIDPPAHLYDCESVQIDEDEIDREFREKIK